MSYAERALKTLSAGNRVLLRAVDEASLLQEMCRVIVQLGGYRMAWVGRVEQDAEKSIRPLAHYGFEAGFLEQAHFTWADDGADHGPTAQAVRTGKPAIVQDIATLTSPDLPVPISEPLQRGYAAVAAFPLSVDGRVIGNLSIFAGEPDAFDQRETELLGEMAEDLAFGIATLRIRARHRAAEATIRRMAYVDALTGLANRTALQEQLDAAIDLAHRQHQSLAVLLVKVGRFQEISDTLGYQEGNALLVEMAGRLQGLLPKQRIARVGEDEFALILAAVGAEAATQTARQITRNVCQPVNLAGLAIDAHAHVGMALYPGHGSTADELLRGAKIAAVQARQGDGYYAIYHGAADQESRRRLTLMSDLRRAIDDNELQLYCQPKVGIAAGNICGAEALVRWIHPEHGAIATGQFVALAERAGLMMPLTRWVLETAFRQSHSWHEAGIDCPLAVNLSAQDLRDPQLIERIAGLFATWAMPPRLIQFELTESALMEDPAGALETLLRLKELGVELFIDDFGTGYSSLSYLQKLPVDALKIDQSFVGSMLSNVGSAVIVRSTIELGHNLGLGVVAEGVESEALWNRLQLLGCDTAQGYFVSQPVPAEGLPAWLGKAPWHSEALAAIG
ncbi:MAG: phospholipase [Betaproteobacteria bacterium HGW-Betaproteobacteria-12]|nr:MAG: phospholipase [Betaproteobacteria bacterium HGW-Betaproteobacteria-12]